MVAIIQWSFCLRRRTLHCVLIKGTLVLWSMRVSTNICDSALHFSSVGYRPTQLKKLHDSGNFATPPAFGAVLKVRWFIFYLIYSSFLFHLLFTRFIRTLDQWKVDWLRPSSYKAESDYTGLRFFRIWWSSHRNGKTKSKQFKER